MASRSKKYTPVDLSGVKRKTNPRQKNRTQIDSFGRPSKKSGADFFDSLPDFLKASELNEFVGLIVKARQKERPFHLMMGAHSIKVGLSPILIDLMRRGIVTGLSFNSAVLIHDLELSFFGATSEDVAAGLSDGSFGMVKKTAELFAAVTHLASEREIGLGEAAGIFINNEQAKYRKVSMFAQADKLNLPVTVHVGIGTDIVAQHPEFDPAAAGAASHLDFRLLASLCADIDQGGVVANIGSAVILPEVFLKALTVARNLGKHKSKLVTANFDMIFQYRPMQNIVNRPTAGCGKGFNFVGHHEIMIPLLAWALRREF